MKMKLMTPEAIKEIESLIPDHEEALMRWGAQMYREGIVKGGYFSRYWTDIKNDCGCCKRTIFRYQKQKIRGGVLTRALSFFA